MVFYTVAVASLVNLVTARFFMDSKGDRLSVGIEGFTIGNSNDLAAHLLLVLAFLLFITMDSKRNSVIRFACLAGIGYGLWIIVGTASRGALLAVVASAIFLLWRASMAQRFVTLAVGSVMAAVFVIGLPQATLGRLETLVGERNIEADESAASRSYLFQKSVLYSVQHPIFGVGPDQFINYEGKTSMTEGRRGAWHATHCTFTQVSSECGIPALIFYVCGLVSAILMVNRTYRIARQKGHVEIANACFCYLLGMVGFLVAITFLANAYRFYFPLMIGLSVSMSFAATRQMTASSGAGSLEPAHAIRR
jgi:putative inorganic carbon (HCO3(-)) transporter